MSLGTGDPGSTVRVKRHFPSGESPSSSQSVGSVMFYLISAHRVCRLDRMEKAFFQTESE